MSSVVSARRRREVLDALRRGTVPHNGLDLLAVGLSRFESALDSELESASAGGAVFKAVRGEYGSGKTFFSRWLGERAKRMGMAVAEVQISETETPAAQAGDCLPAGLRVAGDRGVSPVGVPTGAGRLALRAGVRRRLRRRAGREAACRCLAHHAGFRFCAARLPQRAAQRRRGNRRRPGRVAWRAAARRRRHPSRRPACAVTSTTSAPSASSRGC